MTKYGLDCILVLSVLVLSVPAAAHATVPSFLRLNDMPGSGFTGFYGANSVSADGSVVVGKTSTTHGYEASRGRDGSHMMVLGHLSGRRRESTAYGTSADGSVVVGQAVSSHGHEAFRWTERAGMVGLGKLPGGAIESKALGVSADGSIVVGWSISGSGCEAFRWTEPSGMVGLGDLSGGTCHSVACSVSADGSTVVGESASAEGDQAFRWTQQSGMVGLGDLPGGYFESSATDLSADGSVVVGYGQSAAGREAFSWTEEEGMAGLGHLPGHTESIAMGVSADGSVVVGWSGGGPGHEAFIWDRTHGMRRLGDVLTDLGTDLFGWKLSYAVDVSADGKSIVGTGFMADGRFGNWVANFLPLPAPASVAPFTHGHSALLITLSALAAIGGLIMARSLRRSPLPSGINVGAVLGIAITALATTSAYAATVMVLALAFTMPAYADEPNEDFNSATVLAPGVLSVLDALTASGPLNPDTILGTRDQFGNIEFIDDDSSPYGNGLASALYVVPTNSGSIDFAVSGYDDFDFVGAHPESGDYEVFVDVYDLSEDLIDSFSSGTQLLQQGLVNEYSYFDSAWIGGSYDVYIDNGQTIITDIDFFRFTGLTPGTPFAARTSNPDEWEIDTFLGWFNDLGELIEFDDDSAGGYLSLIIGNVPANGQLTFAVTGFGDDEFIGQHSESGAYGLELELNPDGDYNDDGIVNAADVDILWSIVRGADPGDLYPDVNDDGFVNEDDVDTMLASMLTAGAARQYGDADLDGGVGGLDYTAWRERAGTGWANGDFDGDGGVGGLDYTLWRTRPTQFPGAVGPHAGSGPQVVPEPATFVLGLFALASLPLARRYRILSQR